MKEIEFNEEGVKQSEIDRTVDKVRGLIFNKNGEVLLCNYAGVYLLPGGSIEDGETITQAFLRESKEETGIDLDYTKAVPFLKIKSFNKNYYDRKLKKDINRLTQTTFFEARTEKNVAIEKRELTQSEKEKGFSAKFVNMQSIPMLLKENKSDNPKLDTFNRELTTVLEEYFKWKHEQIKIEPKTKE